MMKYLQLILISVLLLLLQGCGESGKFKIKGQIEGNPSMNLYIMYYDGNAVRTGVTVARMGQFEAEGSSRQPTVVEFLDNEYRVIGRILARNGDNVECVISRANPFDVHATGSPLLEEWAAFSNENAAILAKGGEEANALIEKYIAEHPDSPVCSLAFATAYDGSIDPARADSVMQSIGAAGRLPGVLDSYATVSAGAVPQGGFARIDTLRMSTDKDTLHTFVAADKPHRVFVFTTEYAQHADSAKHKLRRIAKHKDAEVVEVIFTPDTLSWKRTIRRDTATWTQAWTPGGMLSPALMPFAIPRVPFVVVVDSAGRQVWRGTSLDSVETRLHK